jgi:hypothetical protein
MGDFEHMADVVDLEGYTEIWLGLTPWTVGFEVALGNYIKNMVQPWGEMRIDEEDTVADDHTVVARLHTTATHVGEFLGLAATGRRIEWDAITMVRVEHDRVVGQWAQPDLFAIYRQIADFQIMAAPVAASLENAPSWAYSAPVHT